MSSKKLLPLFIVLLMALLIFVTFLLAISNKNSTSKNITETQSISLSDKTIKIDKAGKYILSGKISDGQIIVDADDADDIELVLSGVSVSSSSESPIYIKDANSVLINTEKGTINTLETRGAAREENERDSDSAVYSKSEIGFKGEGTLNINANRGDAFVSKKDINISGGIFRINAQNDAFHTDKILNISGGNLEINSNDDVFHAEKEINVSGGKINVTRSHEGFESKIVSISGGDISLNSDDDGINAGGNSKGDEFAAQKGVSISVSGGNIYINSKGDGIDSNGDISISGGNIIVEASERPDNAAIDYNGEATISGGTILAIGNSAMAANFTNATQGSILLNLNKPVSREKIQINDYNSGKEIYSYAASKSFNSVLFSSPDIKNGNTYSVSIGETKQNITLNNNIFVNSFANA